MNKTFKALSDLTRRQILDLLLEKEMSAGEIAEHFSISKPSVSHHLNVLKEANLVLDEKKGQFVYYSLNTTVFHDVIKWMIEFTKKEEK